MCSVIYKMFKESLLCVLLLITVLSLTSAKPAQTVREVRDTSSSNSSVTQPCSTATTNLKFKLQNLTYALGEIKKKVSYVKEDTVTIILKQFNFTCRTFTSIMMLKLQLQDNLFEVTYNKTEISDIIHMLVYLETAAGILQNISLTVDDLPCVKFAPSEYKIIYNSMVDEDQNEVQDKKFSKLLNKLLDDTAKVFNFVNAVSTNK